MLSLKIRLFVSSLLLIISFLAVLFYIEEALSRLLYKSVRRSQFIVSIVDKLSLNWFWRQYLTGSPHLVLTNKAQKYKNLIHFLIHRGILM